MTQTARKFRDEILALPEQERLEIACDILASVDGPEDQGWDDAWLAELERRREAAAARGEPAPEWKEVRARVLARLAQQ